MSVLCLVYLCGVNRPDEMRRIQQQKVEAENEIKRFKQEKLMQDFHREEDRKRVSSLEYISSFVILQCVIHQCMCYTFPLFLKIKVKIMSVCGGGI
jgi:hypothetical protein